MTDESTNLHRIIADCVQFQFRYLDKPLEVAPHAFGERVAEEIMRRLRSAGIEVISR